MNTPIRPTPSLDAEIERLRLVRTQFLRQADEVGQMIERVEALRHRQIEGRPNGDQ